MRFSAQSHLRRPADFARARQSGRRHFGGTFTLWVAPQATVLPTGSRIGVVASRAAVGNAVHRNRAKRRMREVFRAHQNLVPPGYDLVMVARSSLNRVDLTEVAQRFRQACETLFRIRSPAAGVGSITSTAPASSAAPPTPPPAASAPKP